MVFAESNMTPGVFPPAGVEAALHFLLSWARADRGASAEMTKGQPSVSIVHKFKP